MRTPIHLNGRSTNNVSGWAPIISAAAPSPKIACPTKKYMSESEGPRKLSTVISEQTAKTRASTLFSAKSLAMQRIVPPA